MGGDVNIRKNMQFEDVVVGKRMFAHRLRDDWTKQSPREDLTSTVLFKSA